MFFSNCLVSKKGPLGATWVAAYFFKKLKKAQIFETNISTSVDNILQDQLDILTYRVLAYLLLGVVRIYSKKVEYLFDDCQEVLIKINEFVVREKNRAKMEALRARCFSITRPVSFDLDAFDLEILEETSGDNAVPHADITLKDVAWKNAGIWQYSLDRSEQFEALDDDFLMDDTPIEDFSFRLMNFKMESRTSHGACDLELSMEKLRYDGEVAHLQTVSGVEEDPPNLVKVFDQSDREHVEVPDMAVLENNMTLKTSREKYNDGFLSEEFMNLHSEAEEDPLGPLKPLAEDQTKREKMKDPDLSKSDNEMHQEDHGSILEARTDVPDIAGSENHMEREASREKCNDRFFSEEGVNLHIEAVEECPSPFKPLAEDQADGEKTKGPDLPQSENEVHQVMEENHVSILESCVEVTNIADSENYIGTEASRGEPPGLVKTFGEEKTNREKMKCPDMVQSENEVHQVMEADCMEASLGKLQAFSHMDIEEPAPVVRPLAEEVQTGAELDNVPAMTTSADGKCQVAAKDHSLLVRLCTTPQSKLQGASGATTPHFMPIRTPVTKERARFSRKRKCFFDDMIVFPNDLMRQWIKDASDLVSKRRKHTARDARNTHRVFNLSQSFSEASVPCTSELKSLYYGKSLRLLESVKIMKSPEKIDVSEAPPIGGSFDQAEIAPETVEIRDPPAMLNLSKSPLFDGSSEQTGIAPQTPRQHSPPLVGGEQTEIAPQTPVPHSKSVRPFESPEYLKCVNLDEVGHANLDPTESMEKESSLIEIVEKEPSLSNNEVLDLNLEIHSNEDDNQEQNGWSLRTRMVAKYLQRRFLAQRKRGEEETVKLSQLLEGRTKKESVRLFYEILVLKTKGLVDVKQDTAFDDILVLQAPQWDETC
ncbi:sister chromatid cohesion 1 protein 2 isoform X2 [Herrania umbratica]|uniref:Sister chromatid cohesion 1 protein 2 isoform X2 n=1 Tax=Herrania umbratica TaxID=108875 RepID=A0A6J1AB95_9ROSI|nr:sister chromatid cohesion 1 protein 2 isoform X2 [Herrania umbratica]